MPIYYDVYINLVDFQVLIERIFIWKTHIDNSWSKYLLEITVIDIFKLKTSMNMIIISLKLLTMPPTHIRSFYVRTYLI